MATSETDIGWALKEWLVAQGADVSGEVEVNGRVADCVAIGPDRDSHAIECKTAMNADVLIQAHLHVNDNVFNRVSVCVPRMSDATGSKWATLLDVMRSPVGVLEVDGEDVRVLRGSRPRSCKDTSLRFEAAVNIHDESRATTPGQRGGKRHTPHKGMLKEFAGLVADFEGWTVGKLYRRLSEKNQSQTTSAKLRKLVLNGDVPGVRGEVQGGQMTCWPEEG